VSSGDGPFTPARVHTDAGMLSALIFRGVTFGTDFLKEHETFFDDIDHFHKVKDLAAAAYTAKHGQLPPTTYFCLSNAYRPPNYCRTVECAEGYAVALQNDSWAARFAFSKGGSPQKRFPLLGPLGSYLLTADLVYAEAVESPTAEEMGSMIQLLNKGAVSRLEVLRLIPQRKKTKKGYSKAKVADCQQAFKRLFDKVASKIPADR
ncbi:hypothetical protein K438DRAFT_1631669, partial [Mycena galopus ATCC 62051]